MNGRNLDNLISPPRDPAWRLLAALALSCLLHALAISGLLQGRLQADSRPQSSWLASRTLKLTAAFLPAGSPHPNASAADPGRAESESGGRSASTPTYGADVVPLSGVPYFPAERLTRRPQPMSAVDLDAPEIQGIPASGRLVLTVWIDASGRVSRVETETSELPGPFATAAAAAFGRSRFIPGEIDGRPVASIVKIEVTYDDPRVPVDDPRVPVNPPATPRQTPSAVGS